MARGVKESSGRSFMPRHSTPSQLKSVRAAALLSSRVERIARVKRYVASNYDAPLTLKDAAQVAALERTYFSRLFHRQTGIRFRDWLRRVRVSHALSLLRQHELTITEVAFAVGFSDLRSFERACVQFAGACPRSLQDGMVTARLDTQDLLSARGLLRENTISVATGGVEVR